MTDTANNSFSINALLFSRDNCSPQFQAAIREAGISTATCPDGSVRRFAGEGAFNSYVREWQVAGFPLRWNDSLDVTILQKDRLTPPRAPADGRGRAAPSIRLSHRVPATCATALAGRPDCNHWSAEAALSRIAEKQGGCVRRCPPLTGCHKEPTGTPARTKAQMGGKGIPSSAAVARPGGSATPGAASAPLLTHPYGGWYSFCAHGLIQWRNVHAPAFHLALQRRKESH